MDSKRLTTRAVVGGVVIFVVGYLFWQMLFASFFAAHAGPGAPAAAQDTVWWAAIVGTLCYATLVALALEWSGAADTGAAFKTGAIVGLLMWGAVDMIFFAFFGFSDLVGAIADPALEAVRGGVAGAAMSMIGAKGADSA